MRFAWWWKVIKQYLKNCNIHGVKYLADDRLTKTERVLWLIFCTLSWLGCIVTIYFSVQDYIKHPVAMTIDTNYLNWQTPFPAVYLCIAHSPTMKQYFIRNPGLLANTYKPKYLTATVEDLLSAYETLRIPCAELLVECTWARKKFNCCEEFQEIRKTGIGYCLGMNTLHVMKNGKRKVHHFLNRTVKYGDLMVDINANATMKEYLFTWFTVHVSSNERFPVFIDAEIREVLIKPGRKFLIEFVIEETYNEDGVRNIAIEHRKCRFYDELRPNSEYEIYSRGACYLEEFMTLSMKLCDCVPFYHYIPPWARVCNATESLCVISHKQYIMDYMLNHHVCDYNCEDSLIITNRERPDVAIPNKTVARIHVTAVAPPLVRYRRYVINSRLDVIVSVGSAIGLFMGGSILSIFEIPYWLFIRRDKIN